MRLLGLIAVLLLGFWALVSYGNASLEARKGACAAGDSSACQKIAEIELKVANELAKEEKPNRADGSSPRATTQPRATVQNPQPTAPKTSKVAGAIKTPQQTNVAPTEPDDKNAPEWLKVSKACDAAYGLHDGSGRNSRAELDCVDYYLAHGKMPPTPKEARDLGDAQNNWIQTLCVGVAGRRSLNQAFQTYDSCLAWAAFVGLSQNEAKRLAAMYGIERP